MLNGGTIILGRKFSAKRFWDDVSTYNVDVVVVSVITQDKKKKAANNIYVYSTLVNSADTY